MASAETLLNLEEAKDERIRRPSEERGANPPALPAKPLITIRGGRSRRGLDLGDFWAHRDLLYFLAWRDVKVRYKQTVLGAAWAILQPLLTMVVFTLLFGRLARVPSEGEPYAIFSYAGLLRGIFLVPQLRTALTA